MGRVERTFQEQEQEQEPKTGKRLVCPKNRDEVSGLGVLSFWELSTTALNGAVPLWERQGSRAHVKRSVMSKTGTSFIWAGREKEGCT